MQDEKQCLRFGDHKQSQGEIAGCNYGGERRGGAKQIVSWLVAASSRNYDRQRHGAMA